jgi:hypothetical protein
MEQTRSQAIALLALLAAFTLVMPPTVQLLIGLPFALAALVLWALRPFHGLTRR